MGLTRCVARSGLVVIAWSLAAPGLWSAPSRALVAGEREGALAGRTVYVDAAGGAAWLGSAWDLQDPLLFSMNADFGNLDQATLLAEFLFNAGATVVPLRPLGHQVNEVILDNDDEDVTFEPSGTAVWQEGTGATFFGDPGDVPFRFADADDEETATATYAPELVEAGFYPVYCWVGSGSDRVSGQLYRIRHTGGEALVRVNHRRVGNGWVWLGTYHFDRGRNPETGAVVISNRRPSAPPVNAVVIADAVRFGNGEGDVERGGSISGFAREAESARYWIERMVSGDADVQIYDHPDFGDDVDGAVAVARMAAEMWRDDGQGYHGDVLVSVDSGAQGCVGGPPCDERGAIALIHSTDPPPDQVDVASALITEIETVASAEDGPWPSEWIVRSLEISGEGLATIANSHLRWPFTIGDAKLNAAAVRLAFHDNAADAVLLREPRVRRVLARAICQGLIRHFHAVDGGALAFPPEPPVAVSAASDGLGGVTVRWRPGPAGGAGGGAADSFRVYHSPNGLGFGDPVTATGISAAITGLATSETHFFRVTAVNSGGESTPSEVVGAHVLVGETASVLVVTGYDRHDRFNNVPEFPGGPDGEEAERLLPRRNNSRDYVIQHGRAVAAAGRLFDSCADEVVASGEINLADYPAVVWALGEESVDDITLGAAERAALSSFLDGGGSLFISGSDVGWDLAGQGRDAAFYTGRLHAEFLADDGNSHTAEGASGSIFAEIVMDFAPGSDIYDADAPDVIGAVGGSAIAATYAGGGGGAAVQFAGPGHRVVYLAFPFETISDPTVRARAMRAALDSFGLPVVIGPSGLVAR